MKDNKTEMLENAMIEIGYLVDAANENLTNASTEDWQERAAISSTLLERVKRDVEFLSLIY